MKIAFYISTLGKGGAERVISNLANYFVADENNEVTVILERPVMSYELNKRVNLITLEDKKNSNINFFKRKLRYLSYYKKLKNIFKNSKFDILVSFLPVPTLLSLMTKNKETKVIISVRNDPKIEYKRKIRSFLMKRLFPKADGFVFQTKEAQEFFREIINCKQTIIYNAVSKAFIDHEMPIKRKNEIVSVGRLENQKNYPLLINAFSVIANEYKNYNLIIYGDGTDKDSLIKLVEEKKLINRVQFAGKVNNVQDKIFDASMYILSSNYEGMPNALIEAMILGLPVISTNCPCGGPNELIVNNKNGILTEVNNIDEMVDAMRKILDNNNFANELSYEARKIINKVSPEIINKQWEEFFKNVLED